MNVTKLTQKLITIPSYVDDRNNEIQLADYLFDYIQNNLPWMKLEKQYVEGDRYNIIASTGDNPQLLICAHMDTVQPKQGWSFNQFAGKIINNAIYGLGTADMKNGIAATLKALESVIPTKNILFLLYIDEEYEFKGMKKFINEYQDKLVPKFIFSTDNNGMQIVNGCRGIIEVSFEVEGKTGHAADEKSGNNAIMGTMLAICSLSQKFKKEKANTLGRSTLNLAYLQGGLNLGLDNLGNTCYGKRGNNIPDFAEGVLEIRSNTKGLTAQSLQTLIQELLKKEQVTLRNYTSLLDYGSWVTDKNNLRFIEDILRKEQIPISYKDPTRNGYLDTQMLWKTFSCDCASFGIGENSHGVNENIRIDELIQLQRVVERIIQYFIK